MGKKDLKFSDAYYDKGKVPFMTVYGEICNLIIEYHEYFK